jgi:hypothetical protein
VFAASQAEGSFDVCQVGQNRWVDDVAYSNIDFGDAFCFYFERVQLIGNALAWKRFFRCAGLRGSFV